MRFFGRVMIGWLVVLGILLVSFLPTPEGVRGAMAMAASWIANLPQDSTSAPAGGAERSVYLASAPTSLNWQSGVSAPSSPIETSTAVLNGKIIRLSGLTPTGGHSSSDVYDPASGTWTSDTTLRGGPDSQWIEAQNAAVLDGQIHIINSQLSTYSSRHLVYDPFARSWHYESQPSNVTSWQGYIPSAVLDNVWYVITGDGAQAYSPITKAWRALATPPSGSFAKQPVAAAFDGRIYLISGAGVFVYDPIADQWTNGPSLPSTFQFDSTAGTWNGGSGTTLTLDLRMARAAVAGGVLYVAGGETLVTANGVNTRLRHGGVYALARGASSWTAVSPGLTVPRDLHGLEVVGGKLYALTGWDGVPLTTLEYVSLPSGVTVDGTAPTVSLSPITATVKATITLQATASDASGVLGVRFFEGTRQIGESHSAPFSIAYETIYSTEGAHTYTAVAYDPRGNWSSSAQSTTVANLDHFDVTVPISGMSQVYLGDRVIARDDLNRRVTGFSGSVTLAASGGATLNQTSRSLSSGIGESISQWIAAPTTGTYQLTATSANGKTGTSSGISVMMPYLDWSTASSMALPAVRTGSTAFWYNGELYIAGGSNSSGNAIGNILVFRNGAWTTLTTSTTAMPNNAAITLANGKVWVLGGDAQIALYGTSTLYAYDLTIRSWAQYANLPSAQHGGTAVAYNGRIYTAGGQQSRDQVDVYDITSNTWLPSLTMPSYHFYESNFMWVADGKINVYGKAGYYSTQEVYDSYDPATGTWTTVQVSGGPDDTDALVGGVVNGKLVGFRQRSGSYWPRGSVFVLEPGSSTWIVSDPHTNGLWQYSGYADYSAFAAYGGQVFLLGGSSSTSVGVGNVRWNAALFGAFPSLPAAPSDTLPTSTPAPRTTAGYHVYGDVVLDGLSKSGTTIRLRNADGSVDYTATYGNAEANTSIGRYAAVDLADDNAGIRYFFDVPSGSYAVTAANGSQSTQTSVSTSSVITVDLGYGRYYGQRVDFFVLPPPSPTPTVTPSPSPTVPPPSSTPVASTTPVQSATPVASTTPVQSATPVASTTPVAGTFRGLYGRVSVGGSAAVGISVQVRRWNGLAWSTVMSTTTAADGAYDFVGLSTLSLGQAYRVLFSNDGTRSDLFLFWYCPVIRTYTAGSPVAACDFDLKDVALSAPADDSSATLPVKFSWTPRGIGDETYSVLFFNEAVTANPFGSPGALNGSSFILRQLPASLSAGTPYWWTVRIVRSDGALGISQNFRKITLAVPSVIGDLGVVDTWTEPETVREGNTVSLGALIRNYWITTSGGADVAFYDGKPSEGGTLIKTVNTGPIDPLDSLAVTTGVTWNTAGMTGTHKIYVLLDPNQQTTDIDRSDNTATMDVDIRPSGQIADTVPPTGTITINGGVDTTTSPTVTLTLSASDPAPGSGVSQMYVSEIEYDQNARAWTSVNRSGWITYTTLYSWTLQAPGVRFLRVWFADRAGNISNRAAVAAIDYLTTRAIMAGDRHFYRLRARAGQSFTISLDVLSGDADLYGWKPGSRNAPDFMSQLDGTQTDSVTITPDSDGVYHVEVIGYADQSSYTISAAAATQSKSADGQRAESAIPADPGSGSVRFMATKVAPSQPLVSDDPSAQSQTPSAPTTTADTKLYTYLPIVMTSFVGGW